MDSSNENTEFFSGYHYDLLPDVRGKWIIFKLIDWLSDWLIDWLIEWLSDWVIDWLNDWLIDWLIEWLIDWVIDWVIVVFPKGCCVTIASSSFFQLVVERIFCYLPKRSRYEAAQTCKAWLRVLHFPRLWRTFALHERTLTRSRFDYYKGVAEKSWRIAWHISVPTMGFCVRRLPGCPEQVSHESLLDASRTPRSTSENLPQRQLLSLAHLPLHRGRLHQVQRRGGPSLSFSTAGLLWAVLRVPNQKRVSEVDFIDRRQKKPDFSHF